jgi:ABC-type Mn2+/Zn2+ transport system permease subunit
MGSSFWTVVGVVLTLAMIVLSAFINYSFGYSLGTTETNARIFGGVSVVDQRR